jgi:hypothetical protein
VRNSLEWRRLSKQMTNFNQLTGLELVSRTFHARPETFSANNVTN